MPKAEELARAGPRYLGTPYSKMDCQAFIEKCLKDIEIDKDLGGSNAWYREVRKNGWTGTPEECRKKFGCIPKGAFLFIHVFDGGEKKRGYSDDLGNAKHIGIYTGISGAEMCDMAIAEGVGGADRYNFGNGAIHSSETRGSVCTSNFHGKTISGGWNMVGLWDALDYGIGTASEQEGRETVKAEVFAENGSTVNMRIEPSTRAALVERVPVGAEVEIIDRIGDWCYISREGRKGYMMQQYLFIGEKAAEDPAETVAVKREWLESIYGKIGEMLGKR